MKRLIPALFLMLAVLPVRAEFTKYHDDDELIAYLDTATISRAGREVRMWTIDDYRKPQNDIEGKTYLSVRSHWIFDCARNRSDVLAAFYHAEGMAQGAVVHSGAVEQRQWDAVVAGSVGELAFRAACLKK